jgi:hypothetical protein
MRIIRSIIAIVSVSGVVFLLSGDLSGQILPNFSDNFDEIHYVVNFNENWFTAKCMIVTHEGRLKIASYEFWCPACTKRTYFYLTNNGNIEQGVRLHERGLKDDWTIARIIDWGGGNFMIPFQHSDETINMEQYNNLSLYEVFNQFKFGDAPLRKYREPGSYAGHTGNEDSYDYY